MRWAAALAIVFLGACNVAPEPTGAMAADVAHLRSAGFACGNPTLDSDDADAGAGAIQVACRATVGGAPLEITLDGHPQGDPLVVATLPQALGRQAAAEAWLAAVIPMPGLAPIRDEVALWLPIWASGGSAEDRLTAGRAWISSDPESVTWSLAVDLAGP